MRDQRLRHAGIDVVMRHVVADAVGAPAQCELAQVAGADHDAVVVIGQPEQVIGALAGLHVLEGYVVDRLAVSERMAQVLEHRQAARPDVDLARGAADHLHQPPGLLQGAIAGGKARHREAEDIGARQSQPVHRLGADQQRMGRIQAAGDADHHLRDAGGRQTLHQRLHLDLVDLVAAFVAPPAIGRHIGEALDAALQRQIAVLVDPQHETDGAELRHLAGMAAHRIAERRHVHALAREPLQIDVGEDHVRIVGEALRFGQQFAVLVDQRLAIPGEVGGRFALAGRAVQIGGQATGRLLRHQLMAVAGLADHDIGRRQIDQHRCPRQRGERRRRDRHPDVLADLDMEAQQRDVLDLEQQAGAERHALAQQVYLVDRGAVGRAELAGLVEFPVIGQEALGNDATQLAAGDHHRAVEQLMLDPQRHADHQRARQRARGLDDLAQRTLAGVEQGLLMEQVVAAVGRQTQLGEGHQRGAGVGRLAGQRDGLLRVEGGIGDLAARHADRHAHEAMGIQIEESAHLEHPCCAQGRMVPDRCQARPQAIMRVGTCPATTRITPSGRRSHGPRQGTS